LNSSTSSPQHHFKIGSFLSFRQTFIVDATSHVMPSGFTGTAFNMATEGEVMMMMMRAFSPSSYAQGGPFFNY
jgi:hypothetical protein